ncbi:YwmB family TATA-box binding protein [Paenibacillus dakarensis]|uniref:YwmB family TATA-box binding protein n=1 Tax=Paenibacillus dakarensis TaxID=1527293 RepID=UPI0006D547C7|nr:YwmB family TATA-box binding protein [Paenibacillus dakarensis]
MRWFEMKLVAGMILLFAVAGGLAGFADQHVNKKTSEPVQEDHKASLELLYSLGRAELDSPLHLTVKLQGESTVIQNGKNEEAVQSLAHEMGLNRVIIDIDNEEHAYRARGNIYGIDVRIDWVESRGRNYVKVQFDTEELEQLQQLIECQDKAAALLEQAGMKPAWNASVQGNMNNGLPVIETIQSIEEKLAMHLRFNEVDSYQDSATVSRSYEAPSLTAYVNSGEQPIHMQVAVHKDSMNKSNRITIGMPVITIEY